MDLTLSRTLHTLTARLDRAADRILRTEAALSYPRFLALVMVGLYGADTQRALAERLGVTEPSASRMTRVLEEAGYLDAAPDPRGGNRHRLRLTQSGRRLVERWGGSFEERLAALTRASGVPYSEYLQMTQRLLDTLDESATPQSRARQATAGGSGGTKR